MRKFKTLQKSSYVAPGATPLPVPVPTGGWDAISPLAAMDPKNAVVLQNWVPRPGWIELRPGYNTWAQQINSTNPVETLMHYTAPGAEKLFAVCAGNIYDVSNVGVATLVHSGMTNSRCQYCMFSPLGTGIYYLVVVNGADPPLIYNGTTWANMTLTGSLNPNKFISVNTYQFTIWFTVEGTTEFAYMLPNAISGAYNFIDLGGEWTKGGDAVAMATWTVDGGSGPNNYAAFVSSQGQVSLFLGTNPANANLWNLVGTFDLPPPIGDRPVRQLGSDVGIITLQGVLPLSQALPYDPSSARSISITAQIQNAMAQAAVASQNAFGWQLISFPAQTVLILNVPIMENAAQQQYVMNTLTGAWCNFTGWNANCFEIYQNNLYFGDNSGNVNQAWVGGSDGLNAINAVVECAFNQFDMPDAIKRITMVQPMMVTSGNVNPNIQINVDFAANAPSAPTASLGSLGALWDIALWDASQWSGGIGVITAWISAEGVGRWLSIQMAVSITTPGGTGNVGEFDIGAFDQATFDGISAGAAQTQVLQIQAFNVMLEKGGVI